MGQPYHKDPGQCTGEGKFPCYHCPVQGTSPGLNSSPPEAQEALPCKPSLASPLTSPHRTSFSFPGGIPWKVLQGPPPCEGIPLPQGASPVKLLQKASMTQQALPHHPHQVFPSCLASEHLHPGGHPGGAPGGPSYTLKTGQGYAKGLRERARQPQDQQAPQGTKSLCTSPNARNNAASNGYSGSSFT